MSHGLLLGLLSLALLTGQEPPGPRGPLKESEIVFLLQAGVSPARVRALAQRQGIDFVPSDEALEIVRAAGGDAALLDSLKALAPATPSPSPSAMASVPPPAGARPAASAAPGRAAAFEPETRRVPGGPAGDLHIGVHEVTNRQYLAFCRRSGRPRPDTPFWGLPDDFAVVNVTWYDAQTFCRWLSLETGRRYRLPTEVEWEHAARGGARRPHPYPWGDEPPAERSCFGLGSPCAVGSFKPNGFGLYDMAGGVAEWCQDLYAKRGKERVIRGGSWASPLASPEFLSLSRRDRLDPDKKKNEVGFRVARDP